MNYRLRKFMSTLVDASTSDVPSQLPSGLPSTSSVPSFPPTSECLLPENTCDLLAEAVTEAAEGLGEAEAKEDKCCPKPSTSPSLSLAPSSQPSEFCPDPDTLTDECKTELVTELCHND